jgi:hypothetical protein
MHASRPSAIGSHFVPNRILLTRSTYTGTAQTVPFPGSLPNNAASVANGIFPRGEPRQPRTKSLARRTPHGTAQSETSNPQLAVPCHLQPDPPYLTRHSKKLRLQ